MQRHNWRKAASYMYLYSARLRTEPVPKDSQHMLSALQERLNGLSAAINALHLVHPAYAWIDPFSGKNSIQNEHYPRKKAKKTVIEQCKWLKHNICLLILLDFSFGSSRNYWILILLSTHVQLFLLGLLYFHLTFCQWVMNLIMTDLSLWFTNYAFDYLVQGNNMLLSCSGRQWYSAPVSAIIHRYR